MTPVRSSASEMFSKTASEKERLDMEGMFHNSVVVCCPHPTHFCGLGITHCWHRGSCLKANGMCMDFTYRE